MIRLGIIGLGHMGRYHATVAQRVTGAALVALADCDRARLDSSTNVYTTTDYTKLLPLVDAVIIAVPTAQHYQVAKTCLEQGRHILLEKPLTPSVDEARSLAALALQHNRIMHIGHVERFNGAFTDAISLITQPQLIQCHRIGPFNERTRNDSVVLDLMIHDIDLLLTLIKEPIVDLQAHGSRVYTQSCDSASVTIHFSSDITAHLIASRVAPIKRRTMTIHQADGVIALDFAMQESARTPPFEPSQSSGYRPAGSPSGRTGVRPTHTSNPLQREQQAFVNAIQAGDTSYDLAHDIRVLELTLAIERMANLP